MTLTPVTQPMLLADRVFDTIHAAILDGDLPAGTQLKVRDLAQQVGTSVMPVREAIRRLEDLGLVRHEPHKGSVVKSLTTAELVHTYELRRVLEIQAARDGATAITNEQCRVMHALGEDLVRAVQDGALVQALDLDERILHVLYQAAGNGVLVQTIGNLWRRCRAYKLRGARRARELSDPSLWSFQGRILAAADNRDGSAAADITGESVRSAMDRIRSTLDDR